MRRVPLIVGCTATGKTALGVHVCHTLRRLGCERPAIINADALQVYRGADIGVAKATSAERDGVPHYLLDVCDPAEVYDVQQWEAAATHLLQSLPTPVVVGGSHMYIRALLQGIFRGPGTGTDADFRATTSTMTNEELHAKLQQVDAARASELHVHDRRRVVRALELFHSTGRAPSSLQNDWVATGARFPVLLVHIATPRSILHRIINRRVQCMLEDGLVDEVHALWRGGSHPRGILSGIGYKEMVAHLQGRCTMADAVERIKIATRRLAKHQRKWVRKLSTLDNVHTLTLSCPEWEDAADMLDATAAFDRGATASTRSLPHSQQQQLDALLQVEPPWESWAQQVADATL